MSRTCAGNTPYHRPPHPVGRRSWSWCSCAGRSIACMLSALTHGWTITAKLGSHADLRVEAMMQVGQRVVAFEQWPEAAQLDLGAYDQLGGRFRDAPADHE